MIMKFNWKQLIVELLRVAIAALSGWGGANMM